MRIDRPRLSGHWQQGRHNQRSPSAATQATRRATQQAREIYWRPRLLSAWQALAPPRTIKALAAALGELPSSVQSRLARYHLTRAELNAGVVAR